MVRGTGDAWMRGDQVDGVSFALHERVAIMTGEHAGRVGLVALLLDPRADPLYLVALADGGGDARIRQSEMLRSE